MSEIEKMYENCGIKPKYIDACTVEDKYWQDEELANEYGTFDMYMNAKCGQQEDCTTLCSCAYTKEEYPQFTAEEQLELIKWLAVKGDFDSSIDIAKNTYDYWTIYFQGARCTADGFEESLAGLINNLWQDLTEAERKQIKDILKECKDEP